MISLHRKPPASLAEERTALLLKQMMPGMLIEQAAAILLANANVFVMRFISTSALAGVGQISTLNSILMNLFQAFAIGGTAVVARQIGAGKAEEARQAAGEALKLGLLISLSLTVLIWLFREPIVYTLFGSAEADVVGHSLEYFEFTALAPVFWFLYFQCCGFLRSAGDTRRPMLVSIALNSSAIVLNLLLVLVFHLGVRGSALAYLCSAMLGAVLSLAALLGKTSSIRPAFAKKADGIHGVILSISVPAAVENLMFNGNRLVLQVFLAGMGTAMISANQIFNSVNEILLVPFMAYYALTVPIVGRAAGEGDHKDLRQSLRYLLYRADRCALAVAVLHVVLCVPLGFVFTRDTEVLRIAVVMLLVFAVIAPLESGCFILPNAFKAVGDAKFPMVFSTFTAWSIRVLGTWILGVCLGWGAYGIIVTQGIDYVVRTAVYTHRYQGTKWLHGTTDKTDR